MKKHHKKNTFIFKNNFSIRKLKFGVASITLGSALIIGAHQEAKADENSGNQNDNVSTNQNVQNKDQSTQQVQNQPKNTSATQNSNTQNTQPTTVQDQNAQANNTKSDSSQSAELSESLNFQVQKDKTNEVSHMDQYVQHPGKVIKKNDKYYFQITLENASWWKSFQFFDESETELPTTVVDDNTEKDTKTVNIEVTPGMNNIISKVHIVIPALKYDHEYTTHIELESVIPTIEDPEPTTPQEQPKQNDTTQDQQPATDKTESSTPEKPTTSVNNTETQKQDVKAETPSETGKKDDNKVEKPTTTQTDTTSKQNKSTTNPSEKDRKDKKDKQPKKDKKVKQPKKDVKNPVTGGKTGKDSKVNKNDSDSKSTNELPQTGSHKESNNGVIFSLIALFSSLFFIKRKSNKNI
ncbi:YSIRK signal domain/LPXTG anchor domain surface protein [Staphylococcus sp. HMSC036D05]|uniref:NEAT domain-containing protein n=1 Tax=Staphylococcus sp. HMSC036D05 TaxID=1715059 RepID=UPI0008A91030|nr:NEAT domain-containing protein [Staphylococcus sp. HMSC036D05]OHO72167.1 YSIRK signal domain/LPXTG anchor domain surface protein [Staphylococcus sp. HMSC036D05]